jgi:phenylpropionate dioxygenase-like ring-hydroxylating dioxygenase large terminal subunit
MTSPFAPEAYEDVRRPALAARMLPPGCYVDPDFHDREMARIFRRNWLFLDHEDRIPNSGDYFTTEIAGVGVLVARDEAGTVRAHANFCRHRGCRLVDGEGNACHFQCRYHGWVYDLSGALRGAPQMHHTPGFDAAEFGLRPVRLDRWGGFLFVNFDDAAPGLRAHLGTLHEMLAPYRFDDLVVTRRREIGLACNWKVYFENLMEPYHTPYVHAAGLAGKNEDDGARMLSGNARERFGEGGEGSPVRIAYGPNHAALIARHAGSRGVLPGEEPFPPRPGLAGAAAEGSIWAYVNPATVFSCQREAVWWNQLVPHGPDRTTLVIGSCFPAATVARPDFAARVEAYYRRLDQTAGEDLVIVAEQQAGLSSPLALPGPVNHLEVICHAHRNWVLDRVLDAAG